MIERYETPEMKGLWSSEARFQNWLKVELSVLEAYEKKGEIPQGTYKTVQTKCADIDWAKFSKRALEIEQTTKHDVIAFLTALEEVVGEPSRFIHLGMTSSDVVDTSFALTLKKAGEQISRRLSNLVNILSGRAHEFQNTPCLGRTHGQAAEPTTFGLKLLSYVAEFQRFEVRLKQAIENISFGQISGAVGNYGNADPEIEKIALKTLGLNVEPLSTQIINRDRHAEYFACLAIMAGGIERLAVEIRHLMRFEVFEAFESFSKGQRGSSAMPHKKNPILTENLTGLCRLIRNYAGVAFENQALWHERDISHSSAERVIGPDSTTLTDFALARLSNVMENLVVDEDRMAKNLAAAGEVLYSESILLALVKKGFLRQEAYGWVQEAAMASRKSDSSFKEELKKQVEVKKHLSDEEIDGLMSLAHHLRHKDAIFERVL